MNEFPSFCRLEPRIGLRRFQGSPFKCAWIVKVLSFGALKRMIINFPNLNENQKMKSVKAALQSKSIGPFEVHYSSQIRTKPLPTQSEGVLKATRGSPEANRANASRLFTAPIRLETLLPNSFKNKEIEPNAQENPLKLAERPPDTESIDSLSGSSITDSSTHSIFGFKVTLFGIVDPRNHFEEKEEDAKEKLKGISEVLSRKLSIELRNKMWILEEKGRKPLKYDEHYLVNSLLLFSSQVPGKTEKSLGC